LWLADILRLLGIARHGICGGFAPRVDIKCRFFMTRKRTLEEV